MENLLPEAKAHIEAFEIMSTFPNMEPQAVRELLAQAPEVEMELPDLASIENRMIDVEGNEQINIRIYTPKGDGPFPLFVYYHGGGWVIGDANMTDATCRMIANTLQRIVISVEYRLAPEYKFPIPANDCYTALHWAHDHATEINGSASDIVVGGDSAGGNLSAVVSMMARDKGGPNIKAQILVYPVTSAECNTESYEQFKNGFALDKDLMIWFIDHYIRNEEDKHNPYVAPLVSDNLNNLPPAFVITAENDVLRDEGNAYAKRLKEANNEVESFIEPGVIHGFFSSMPLFEKQINSTIEKINHFINKI